MTEMNCLNLFCTFLTPHLVSCLLSPTSIYLISPNPDLRWTCFQSTIVDINLKYTNMYHESSLFSLPEERGPAVEKKWSGVLVTDMEPRNKDVLTPANSYGFNLMWMGPTHPFLDYQRRSKQDTEPVAGLEFYSCPRPVAWLQNLPSSRRSKDISADASIQQAESCFKVWGAQGRCFTLGISWEGQSDPLRAKVKAEIPAVLLGEIPCDLSPYHGSFIDSHRVPSYVLPMV